MNTFKQNSVYYAMYRIDRLYFIILSRTPRTMQIKVLGIEEDYSQFNPKSIKINNDIQKIRIHKEVNDEYGYYTYFTTLYNHSIEAHVLLEADKEIVSTKELKSIIERLQN